jgi:thimet oligopeptidase
VRQLSLNHAVYQALADLQLKGADAATRYYVERQLLEFRLAGVNKDDATRAKLRELNDKLTGEQSMFDRNIADAKKITEVMNVSELDGLPPDYIDRHKPGTDGKIQISTDYPDTLPALKFAKSEALRRRLLMAFETRAYPKNLDVLKQMMETRYEIAKLLGYSSWADYNAADKMIGKGAKIADFIKEVDTALRPVMQREFAMLLAEKRKTHPDATEIQDYEQSYISEQVRRTQFDFDSQLIRPYLPYGRVKQGILDTASKLFHVTFRQESGVPAWDPSVETWDVLDHGNMIGRIYLDMHPRTGKFSHAEMAPVLDGIREKQLPEAILVCNFPKPTATDPGLMEYGDVVVFFHEFGHLLHWVFAGHQQWAGISGISMESDFVEAPSQMLEEWMHSPQVLGSFARHYKTDEPIPADLIARMNRASAFGRATGTAQQAAYTAISYDLYKGNPKDIDPDKVTQEDLQRYAPFKLLPDTHLYASFNHLGGYSSAYYTYLWDKVIAEDFFLQFDKSNLLAGDAPMRYRQTVLTPGGSVSANDLVRNFLGRPQNMKAFQSWMEEEFQSHR